MSIPDFKRLFRRTWLIGVFIAMVLFALICFDRGGVYRMGQEVAQQKEALEALRQEHSAFVVATGKNTADQIHVLETKIMPSALWGYKSKEDKNEVRYSPIRR